MANSNLFNDNEEIFRLQKRVTELEHLLNNKKPATTENKYLKPDKTFGLAVSGDVLLNKMEVEIISTEAFQRLRKVKQLGSTYLVYPSAVHTRFEHSLGTLNKASTIIGKIRGNRHSTDAEMNITSDEEQIVRLLALLHDIGHMPFGHTIEDEFGIFRSHDKHETRWEFLLGEFSDIGKIIIKWHGQAFFERFYRLIKCEKDFEGFEEDAFIYDIVSNTVCADLLDYLERDCLFTNLKLKYHPRFLDYFFIKNIINEETGKNERRIAIRIYKTGKKEIRHDVISELIQLLRYRYYLGERVYYHHAKIVTGTLIAGAVIRAKMADAFNEVDLADNLKNKIASQSIDNKIDKVIYDIHKMGDEELVLYLRNLPAAFKKSDFKELVDAAARLATAFDSRILYKEIKFWTKDKLKISNDDVINIEKISKEKETGKRDRIITEISGTVAYRIYDKLLRPGASLQRLEIEDTICSYLPDMLSGDILIYCPSFNMAMKLARVKVAYISDTADSELEIVKELKDYKTRDDKTTSDECTHILKRHQELWAFRIFVNPKFVDPKHPEYKKSYEKYIQFIIGFIEWSVLNENHDDEKYKGRVFLNDFLRDRKNIILSDTAAAKINDTDIQNMINFLVEHSNAVKNIKTIDDKITEIANAKEKR